MADYYPLIARAISGLDVNAPGEQRRALYERARTALIAQLRGVEPPLSESEITRERLALEEAVRKVESEAAQRAREASRSGGSRSGDAFRAATRAAMKSPDTATQPPIRSRANATPQPRNLRGDPAPSPPPSWRPPGPPISLQDEPPARERQSQEHLRRNSEPERPPPPVPGFRDVTADADDLGRAAAQANRLARRTYANVRSQSPEFDRLEPSLEDRGGFEGAYPPHEPPFGGNVDDQPPPLPRSWPQPGRDRPKLSFGGGFPLKSAIVVGLVLILAGAGIVWGPNAVSTVRGLFDSSHKTAELAKPATPGLKPKIADRVGQPASSETIAPVAQRVVLYDEDPSDPKGKQYVGSVVWRTEEVKGAAGNKPEIAVRAEIDIPERKFKMTMSFRRNTDTSLPASHTAELTFVLPQDFDGGGVSNVPGILMKSNEQSRGTPLAGLAVKVTDGFFLVGLSNVESDRVRNLQLLKERSWFDVPLVYTNQRRAIIAIEKGAPGERAFNEAFTAWGE
ncbi:hypothetical protein NB311A_05223 [Nitrobacter sp. Nb-311A]|uniref:hypothetical protein n=1 Tax=unclassified Nitrobacter TaxID=2620411 RepID=UPI0000687076|nr:MULTISPECIES: hypothetical protein [unclassified Nitrobacter]EAQ35791.1 hypothetical protein NB311A_05223 [Nitrobacter sp. Nb-311A]MCB1393284.1 hypothetical protein [Nitrobacter sp.]MCV0386355.1 hypothetical protein [Nitrobacter sp.]